MAFADRPGLLLPILKIAELGGNGGLPSSAVWTGNPRSRRASLEIPAVVFRGFPFPGHGEEGGFFHGLH